MELLLLPVLKYIARLYAKRKNGANRKGSVTTTKAS